MKFTPPDVWKTRNPVSERDREEWIVIIQDPDFTRLSNYKQQLSNMNLRSLVIEAPTYGWLLIAHKDDFVEAVNLLVEYTGGYISYDPTSKVHQNTFSIEELQTNRRLNC